METAEDPHMSHSISSEDEEYSNQLRAEWEALGK